MAAQNLINFYLSDEIADQIPDILLQSIFSLLLTHEKPFKDLPPIFYAILLNNVVNLSQESEKLKKLKQQVEEKFSRLVFNNYEKFNFLQQERIVIFLGSYISQSSGSTLGRSEQFLLELTKTKISDSQKTALNQIFAVLCRFISVRKAKEDLDQQFHCYLNQENEHAGANLDEPEADIIQNALQGKDSAEKVL